MILKVFNKDLHQHGGKFWEEKLSYKKITE